MKIWVFWLILVCVICGMFDILTPASPFTDALNFIFDTILKLWQGIAEMGDNIRRRFV